MVQFGPQMRAMSLGLGNDGAMTRQPGRNWVAAHQPGTPEGADGREPPTHLAHSLQFCHLKGKKNNYSFKTILWSSLFIFIMKIFKHRAKLTDLYSGHPYAPNLDSTTDILLYFSSLLPIYPSLHPSIHPSSIVLFTFWTQFTVYLQTSPKYFSMHIIN